MRHQHVSVIRDPAEGVGGYKTQGQATEVTAATLLDMKAVLMMALMWHVQKEFVTMMQNVVGFTF